MGAVLVEPFENLLFPTTSCPSMVVHEAFPELFSKYSLLFGQVGEFVLVSVILYLPGRFVVHPIVRWVFERKGFDPTIERTIEKPSTRGSLSRPSPSEPGRQDSARSSVDRLSCSPR